jgi:hypothetical protein
MKRIIITESQYKTLVTNEKLKETTLDTIKNFSTDEREIFLTLLECKYPNKLKNNLITESRVLTESEWYNVVGDIVGIFDPTGLVDAANAVSYFSQGDVLFGMLSLVSIVPYVGDALAKPVVMGAKLGGAALKPLQVALKSKNTVKIGETLAKLEKGGGFGKKVANFFKGFGDSALITGIKNMLSKISGTKIGKSLKKMVDEWVDIFKKSSKEMDKAIPKLNKRGTYTVTNTATGAGKFISKGEANKLFGKAFVDMLTPLSGSGKAFRAAGKAKRFKGTTALFSGTSPLRKLLNKTKVWGHFLAWAGIEDKNQNVDKVLAKYGEKATGVNFERFINSPDGKKAVKEEFGQTLKDLGEDAILSKLGA